MTLTLDPGLLFYKTRRFHLVITREWLFYFAKTSVIGKRMGGHGYLNMIIFRNGCNLSPKKKKIDIARNSRRTDLKGNKLPSLWTYPEK